MRLQASPDLPEHKHEREREDADADAGKNADTAADKAAANIATLRPALSRAHSTRLLQIWRSAGWPCRDGIEIDLLAAGLLVAERSADGHEALRLTPAGIALLADGRRRNQRALSAHDRLALRVAAHLQAHGRIVWRELSLRALLAPVSAAAGAAAADRLRTAQFAKPQSQPPALWEDPGAPIEPAVANTWRMARPDLFSLRNTSVQTYLQPMVHEIKTSRADLLSDLRHAAKRQAYQWLCSGCYYVFPAGIADASEIPPEFGVWVLHGDIAEGALELLRPARHAACSLPFAVWMSLAKATPLAGTDDDAQAWLGADAALPPP